MCAFRNWSVYFHFFQLGLYNLLRTLQVHKRTNDLNVCHSVNSLHIVFGFFRWILFMLKIMIIHLTILKFDQMFIWKNFVPRIFCALELLFVQIWSKKHVGSLKIRLAVFFDLLIKLLVLWVIWLMFRISFKNTFIKKINISFV